MRLIPAIDLRGGAVVRLLRGDFGAETRYAITPAELLAKYRGLGADWLHVVDLDGARDGGADNRAIIGALARIEAALTQGAARAVIGSAAITQVANVRQWLEEFGGERITLAFDVRPGADGIPRVTTHGWQEQTSLALWDAVAQYADCGLLHVLCTDVSRDGALVGPNLDLYREAHQRFPDLAWQASGGIRNGADLAALAAAGAAAAISGKALLDDLIAPAELRPFLPNA
jgi:phosphoribosylformimino-5-aminoimidazole carboxamide ribotide isomerase